MRHYAKLLVMAFGIVIVCIGLVGMAVPSRVIEFGRSLHTARALYVIGAFRVAFGALLLWVAPVSRVPRTLRVIGAVIIVAGLLTPLFGIERTQHVIDWWASQQGLFLRAWGGIAVLSGSFLVYAVSAPRPSASTTTRPG